MRQSESHAEYNVAGTPGKRFALLLLTGLSLPAWSDITLSLDGEVNGPVTWGNLPSGSDTRMVPGTISLFPKLAAVLGYVSTGNVTHTEPAGMSFFSSQASGDSLKMGFNNNNATDGVVAVSLPGLSCTIEHVTFPDLNRYLSVTDGLRSASLTHVLQPSTSVTWTTVNGGAGVEAQTGWSPGWTSGFDATTTFSGNGSALVYAGKNAMPGSYSMSVPVQCRSMLSTTSSALSTLRQQITVSFVLRAAPTACTLTPPGTVDFGRNIIAGQTSVLLGSREADISARCQTGNGSEDISKGMYLSFSPGSKGLYGNNNKRLKTSLDGIYIAGGSSAPSAGCTVSDMQFDNQVLQAFKMKTITSGINDAKMPLYFSLCHDTSKTLQPGAVESDMGVNLVIK